MAALDNNKLAALDGDFRKRVHSLMLKAATDVANEDGTGKQTTYIEKRADKANYTIMNQLEAVDILSHLTTSLGTLTTESSDNDIEFTIAAVWNAYSGVLNSETTAI